MNVRFRAATQADLLSVQQLLRDAGLITAGVPEHIEHFLLVEDGGRIVASAGLERYGSQALLRSVTVAPEHRNRGLARSLVSRILADAAGQQVQEVYLFTATAPDYFSRFGFVPVARDDVADSVRASEEYGECCADAQAMVLRLRSEPNHLPKGGRIGGVS